MIFLKIFIIFFFVSFAGTSFYIFENIINVLERANQITTRPIKCTIPKESRSRNISYSNKSKDAILDIYFQLHLKKSEQKSPILFFIHGGLWQGGEISNYEHIAEVFFKNGFTVVNIQIPKFYGRVSQLLRSEVSLHKKQFPYQLNFLQEAFSFLSKHLKQYHVDFKQQFVMAYGSGAHLILTNQIYNHHDFKKIILISPILSLTEVSSDFTKKHIQPIFGKKVFPNWSPLENAHRFQTPILLISPKGDFPFLKTQAVDFSTKNSSTTYLQVNENRRTAIFKFGRRNTTTMSVLSFVKKGNL